MKKDYADQTAFVSQEARAKALEENEQVLIEQLKASVIADLHYLQSKIGQSAAKAFIVSEYLDVSF